MKLVDQCDFAYTMNSNPINVAFGGFQNLTHQQSMCNLVLKLNTYEMGVWLSGVEIDTIEQY